MAIVKRHKIEDGVYLNTIITDKFKTSCMSMALMLPINEAKGANSAIIPNILRRGTMNFPDMLKLSEKLDELYGARIEPFTRKHGEVLSIGFIADVIDSAYAKGEHLAAEVATLMSEILFKPYTVDGIFANEYVESEKQNLIDMIGAQMTDKRSYANRRMHEIMCESEAFGKNELGTAEEVNEISAESAFEHYKYLLENARLEIFYCGTTSQHEILSAFSSNFMLPKTRNVPTLKTEVVKKATEVRRVEETLDVAQSKLAIGIRTGTTMHDLDYASMLIANTIFGGSTNSKLFVHVREEMSLCYYASSFTEKVKGIMTISSGVETNKLEIAEKAIFEQFEAVKNGDFTDADIFSAKKTLSNTFRSVSDSPIALENFYMSNICADLQYPPEMMVDKINAVKREDIIKAINKMSIDTIYTLKGGLSE